jgi:hypothetical protein
MTLTNGHKATMVGLMGVLSLLAAGALAYMELGAGQSTPLTVAAFSFFTTTATAALGFLTGASRPDRDGDGKPDPLPLAEIVDTR